MGNLQTWSARAAEREATAAQSVRKMTGPNMRDFAGLCLPDEREGNSEESHGVVTGVHLAVSHYSVRTLVYVARGQSTSARAAGSRDTAQGNARQRTGASMSITVVNLAALLLDWHHTHLSI